MKTEYVDPGEALRSALKAIDTDSETVLALEELTYTASERGLLSFDIRGTDDHEMLVRLVLFAQQQSKNGGVAKRFKM